MRSTFEYLAALFLILAFWGGFWFATAWLMPALPSPV